MKILYSEYNQDYKNYQFPYCIWAFPDNFDDIREIFSSGFLPSGSKPTRFYLARSVRIACDKFRLTSENKRILNKFKCIDVELIDKEVFDISEELFDMCIRSANSRFGNDIMSKERLYKIISSEHTTHYLIFKNNNVINGLVTCFVFNNEFVHYNFSFFDLGSDNKKMGIYLMTRAIHYLKHECFHYIYLGTCYTQKAKYKTQFLGLEFFNGSIWSSNKDELKFLLLRDEIKNQHHLLEDENYLTMFLGGDLNNLVL